MVTRRAIGSIVVAVCSTGLAACLSSLGDLTAGDGAISDAGAESTPGDGAVEATSYCAQLSHRPLFCADFDEGSASAGWDSVVSNLGTVDLSTTQFVSPPAAMIGSIPAAGSGQPNAMLAKTFAQPIGNAALAFDLDIDTIDSTVLYAKLVELSFDGSNPPFTLFLQVRDSKHLGAAFQIPTTDGGVRYGDYGTVPLPPLGTWVHLEIDLFQSATGNTTKSAEVRMNGSVVIPSFSLGSSAAFGKVTLRIGIGAISTPTEPWVVLLDNVTFDEN